MDLDEYTLSEAQRTLKRLGITHLWRDHAPEALSHSDSAPDSESTAPAVESNSRPATQPARTAPARSKGKRTPPGELTAPRPEKSGVQERLSPLLRSLFHGKQSPCRTLWTYDGLHEDLQQTVIAARLEMFRKIQTSVISHLGWPANDVVSWPLDIPGHLFLQGIIHFRPSIIVAFDPSPNLPSAPPESEGGIVLKACRVQILPSLADMAAGDKDLKNIAWTALKQLSPQ